MLKRVQELQRLIDSRNAEISGIRALADKESRQPNSDEATKISQFITDLEGFQMNLELCKREASVHEKLNRPGSDPIRPNLGLIDELQARYPTLPTKDKRFNGMGEQLIAVARAANRSAIPDPRLYHVERSYVERAAALGMSESIPSEGGFLLQDNFSSTILTRSYSTGALLGKVTRMPLSSGNGIKIPIAIDDTESSGIFGGIIAYWLDEAGTKVPSNPKFGRLSLELKKVIALIPSTDELLQDAAMLESFISIGGTKAIVKAIERAIIRGSGVGSPLGILAGCSTTTTTSTGATVIVAKETDQLADTIQYENIKKMWSRMYADSRPNAIWLINQTIEPELYGMGIVNGVSTTPVYLPPGGASSAPYGTLFGRPVIPSNHCSALGDVGDIMLIDPSEYLLIEKGGVQQATSIHVAFTTDQTYFRFVMRLDGQPSWSKVFTPEYGSTATQSPFVTLQARA